MTTPMKPARSFLFVPGNKADWIEKSVQAKADALILDLEDSVPPAQKAEARDIVRTRLPWLKERNQRTWVRINRSPHLYDFDDIQAIVSADLEGVFASKPCGPEDMHTLSSMLAEAEYRNDVPIGHTRIIPLLETARSMQLAYEIAQHERVPAIAGATARNGDSARALGSVWSVEGREAHYMKSRVVMAAHAAGKLPLGGLWQQVRDLEGQEASSSRDRQLGMSGELAIHPASIPIINRIYSPSAEEIAYYEGMIAALDAAQAAGRASCIYDGEHIDIAHVATAREVIAQARSFGDPTADDKSSAG